MTSISRPRCVVNIPWSEIPIVKRRRDDPPSPGFLPVYWILESGSCRTVRRADRGDGGDGGCGWNAVEIPRGTSHFSPFLPDYVHTWYVFPRLEFSASSGSACTHNSDWWCSGLSRTSSRRFLASEGEHECRCLCEERRETVFLLALQTDRYGVMAGRNVLHYLITTTYTNVDERLSLSKRDALIKKRAFATRPSYLTFALSHDAV